MRRVARGLACAWILTLFVGLSVAEEPAVVGEAEFLQDLEKARSLLQAGKAAEGLRLTKETLARHEGKDYARAKRADLEDLVRRLAFRAVCAPPAAKDVVKGKLLDYSSHSGRLEIAYRSGQPTDLRREGSMLVFPARFTGPFTVEIKGGSYPSEPSQSPVVIVGLEEHQKTGRTRSWQIVFGTPPISRGSEEVWMPARIVYRDGDEQKNLVEKAITPAKPGAAYRLSVNVGRGRISANVNGKLLGQGNKSEEIFGYAAFESPGWTEVVFDGVVEPSWVQGKIDEVVQKELAKFEKTFRKEQYLPEWLLREGPKQAPTKRTLEELTESPVPIPRELLGEFAQALVRLAQDDHAGALEAVEALKAKGAPEALCTFLSAQARFGLHETKAALADLDRTLALAPGHLGSQVLRGVVLQELGRDEEAAAQFQAAAAAHPTVVPVYETACLHLLLSGQVDAARQMVEDAARRGLRTKTLDMLGGALVKAQRGPDWPKVHQYRSTNYHVFSDIDEATCRDASKILEEAFTAYRAHLRWVQRDRTRLFKVYLFGGQGGFGSYVEDVVVLGGKAPEHVAGLYSPVLKQLLIWNLPSREEMMRTVRHEGFHQYLDRLLPDPPVWFNEGLAVYYENLERVDGQWKYGSIDRGAVATLRKEGLLPLEKLFAFSNAQFYAGGLRSYGQAWLFCHMLRHGNARHRDLFKALMQRLETEQAFEAVRAVFDAKTLAALDVDLAKHLAALPER